MYITPWLWSGIWEMDHRSVGVGRSLGCLRPHDLSAKVSRYHFSRLCQDSLHEGTLQDSGLEIRQFVPQKRCGHWADTLSVCQNRLL